jgi:predicted membrane channel-forming protein YqfA (hemolysin III family)
MNVLAHVFIWVVVGGAALGVVLHYVVPTEFRSRVARNFIATGGILILFEIAPFALSIDRPNLAPALMASGITLVVFLVAGLVLYAIEKRRSGV